MASTSNPGAYKIQADSCRNRWCPRCSRLRAAKIRANLAPHLEGKTLRMITLTLVSRTEPLIDLIPRLIGCFRDLRRMKLWKEAMTGGVRMIEIKHNPTRCRWHVHLHILCEGKYCPQAALSDAWHAVTGDSKIVDIRAVNSSNAAIHYITKYVTKVIDKSVWSDPSKLTEAITALRGVRLCDAIGTWRGLRLHAPIDAGDWVCVAPLETLLRIRADEEPLAKLLARLLEGIELCQIPPPIGKRIREALNYESN